MIKIPLHHFLISSDLSAIASHFYILPPSLEVKNKVTIKDEEEEVVLLEKQKRSVAASFFFFLIGFLNPLPYPPHCFRPVLLRYALTPLSSEALLHAAPLSAQQHPFSLVLSLPYHTSALTCISSTMATRSAREISLPMIKALSCRNRSSNCFREVDSPSITSWSFSEGNGCPVKRGIST